MYITRIRETVKPTKRSILMKMVAIVLLGIFVLPGLCFGQQTGMLGLAGEMSGRCHGHGGQLPLPSHSCCYAKPQPRAPVQISPVSAPVDLDAGGATLPNQRGSHVLPVSIGAEFFSPPSAVLRI